MNLIRDLIIDNPMMVEIHRFRQRTFSSRQGGTNLAVVILVGVIYLMLLTLAAKFSTDIDPVGLVILQGFLFALLIPVMASGAIAGERERRTWDILLVAPVSKAQLVAGKTVAWICGVGVFALAMLVPILICSVANPGANFSVTAAAEIYSLSFACLLVSVSIFISSRTKTTFAALGTNLTAVFLALVVVPGFWTMALSAIGGTGADMYLNWYPLYVLIHFGDHTSRDFQPDYWKLTLTTVVAYTLVSTALFAGTVWQIRKMEEIGNSPLPEAKEAKKRA